MGKNFKKRDDISDTQWLHDIAKNINVHSVPKQRERSWTKCNRWVVRRSGHAESRNSSCDQLRNSNFAIDRNTLPT